MFSLDFGVRKDSSKSSFSRSSIDSIDSLSGSLKKSFGQPHYKVFTYLIKICTKIQIFTYA